MREVTGHAAGGVMLGEPISAEYIREACIAILERIRIIRTLHLLRGGIDLHFRIERVSADALQRFIVRGQRSILQSAWHPDPSRTVRVHDERLVTSQSVIASGIFAGLVIGGLLFGEIRRVVTCPFFFLFVPPDQLLAL